MGEKCNACDNHSNIRVSRLRTLVPSSLMRQQRRVRYRETIRNYWELKRKENNGSPKSNSSGGARSTGAAKPPGKRLADDIEEKEEPEGKSASFLYACILKFGSAESKTTKDDGGGTQAEGVIDHQIVPLIPGLVSTLSPAFI